MNTNGSQWTPRPPVESFAKQKERIAREAQERGRADFDKHSDEAIAVANSKTPAGKPKKIRREGNSLKIGGFTISPR